jgi:hypothetical protein
MVKNAEDARVDTINTTAVAAAILIDLSVIYLLKLFHFDKLFDLKLI